MFFSKIFDFLAFSKTLISFLIYAPLPFNLPVSSTTTLPSGVLTILSSSFLGKDSLETTQVLKDYSGKPIGNRTSVEKFVVGGARTVETTGVIENEDGKYTLTEYGIADEEGEVIKKQMLKDNKITGEKEELSYQKDEILRRINKYFGYDAISKITFRK